MSTKNDNTQLTGRTRYRSSLLGKLILEVEFYYLEASTTTTARPVTYWRDAKVTDLNTTTKGDPF
jgi:hypothetical protein